MFKISASGCHLIYVYCIHRLRRLGFPLNILLGVFNALFMSTVSYCITLWWSPSLSKIIQVSQNNGIRALCGLPPRTSVSSLYGKLKILKIDHLYVYKVACMAFLAVHKCLPTPLTCNVRPFIVERRLRYLDIEPPTVFFARGVPLNSMALIWNQIPLNIREETKYSKFKSLVKKLLLHDNYVKFRLS